MASKLLDIEFWETASAQDVAETLGDENEDVSLDQHDADFCTPLHIAAQYGKLEAVAEYLDFWKSLLGYDDLNAPDKRGWRPLHYAISGGNDEVIDLLIKAGADINAWAERRQTPLHFAASHDTPDIVIKLIKAGANASLADRYGQTPFDWARDNPLYKTALALMLLKEGAEEET